MACADAAKGIRSTRAVASVMAALALVVDQASKAVVFANLNRGDEMVVLPIFSILPGWNEGAAFGLGQGTAPLLLIFLALAISVWLTKLLIEARSTLAAVGLGAAIGGALANIADRLRFGAVRDFIDVHWEAFHWPTFNVADIFVVVGILLFVLADLLRQR
nr:signal peptidase II [uncultured Sphingorhabdus sp.]